MVNSNKRKKRIKKMRIFRATNDKASRFCCCCGKNLSSSKHHFFCNQCWKIKEAKKNRIERKDADV